MSECAEECSGHGDAHDVVEEPVDMQKRNPANQSQPLMWAGPRKHLVARSREAGARSGRTG